MRRLRANLNVYGLLGGLLALALLTGIARFALQSGVGSAARTRITFWNGFTGLDGVVMLKIIDDFNRDNPDIQVSMQRIPWATYYNKLTVAGSDGRGPEVFIVHADALPRIRRAGFLADLHDLYGAGRIDRADFDPYVLRHMDFGSEIVGVPLDIHPQGMYCNVDMLRAAGYDHAPRNRAEFLDVIAKATIEPGGTLKEKQWGFAFTIWGTNFRVLVPQFGGEFMDEQGRMALNSPGNVQALTFLGELAQQRKAPPPDNGLGWFGFRTKRVAMVWEGVYMLGDLIRLNDLNYIGAPIPQIGPRPGTLGNSHVMCIKRDLDVRHRDAA